MTSRTIILLGIWSLTAMAATATVQAGPAQIILIRHGEKPAEGNGLTEKGRERAAALVPYFQERPEVNRNGAPVAVYAQKSTNGRPSQRAVLTVRPMADALKLQIVAFSHSEFEKMVKEIQSKSEYDGKAVLICWEHHALPDIVKAFGVDDRAAQKWPGEAFDRTWIITFGKDGGKTFQDMPQKLLFGDSAK